MPKISLKFQNANSLNADQLTKISIDQANSPADGLSEGPSFEEKKHSLGVVGTDQSPKIGSQVLTNTMSNPEDVQMEQSLVHNTTLPIDSPSVPFENAPKFEKAKENSGFIQRGQATKRASEKLMSGTASSVDLTNKNTAQIPNDTLSVRPAVDAAQQHDNKAITASEKLGRSSYSVPLIAEDSPTDDIAKTNDVRTAHIVSKDTLEPKSISRKSIPLGMDNQMPPDVAVTKTQGIAVALAGTANDADASPKADMDRLAAKADGLDVSPDRRLSNDLNPSNTVSLTFSLKSNVLAAYQNVQIALSNASQKTEVLTDSLGSVDDVSLLETRTIEPRNTVLSAITSVSRTVNHDLVIRQLTDALRNAPHQSGIQLELDPVELGRVRLSLNASDGALSMLVIAERGETAELLRRNIEQLANELKDMGYENLSFEFQSPSNGDREDAPKHESSHKSDDGSHQVELTEKQETHLISASLASDDRVDIRL